MTDNTRSRVAAPTARDQQGDVERRQSRVDRDAARVRLADGQRRITVLRQEIERYV